MIFTVLQDVVDSVGVVDRCSGTPVDRFELVYVDQCSVAGVDRHQCDPPKLIKLSTSKSPSYSFSSSRTCQKSSSIITFTWCFITSSLTPLVEASCLLIHLMSTQPVSPSSSHESSNSQTLCSGWCRQNLSSH